MKREVQKILLVPFHQKMRILNLDKFQSKFLQFICFLNASFVYCK